jgi:hypothetical protein
MPRPASNGITDEALKRPVFLDALTALGAGQHATGRVRNEISIGKQAALSQKRKPRTLP